MSKVLVLIDDLFPYEFSEPWIEDEIKYLTNFDRVYIAPVRISQKSRLTRNTPDKIKVLPNFEPGKVKMVGCFVLFSLVSKDFWREIRYLFDSKKLSISRLFSIVNFMSHSTYMAHKIKKNLTMDGVTEAQDIVFYSYWMHIPAYTGLLLKRLYRNSIFVTRCHRYDLYEERSKDQYIPMRFPIFNGAHRIYCISQEGVDYLRHKYKYEFKGKLNISHLGSKDYCIQKYERIADRINIVSISGISRVKRVELIAEGILLFSNRHKECTVHWDHYGDGELKAKVEDVIKKFPANVKCILKGNIKHDELLEMIANTGYDLLINSSSSEGVPVSIMESLSFGIPVIATDVGGVSEIIHEGENGILLSADNTAGDISDAIERIVGLSGNEYREYRKKARATWEEEWNADVNYQKFAECLYRLP